MYTSVRNLKYKKSISDSFFDSSNKPPPWSPWSQPLESHQTGPRCTPGWGSNSWCCRRRPHSRGCRSRSVQASPRSPPTHSGGSPPWWSFIQMISFIAIIITIINFVTIIFKIIVIITPPAMSVCRPSPPPPLLSRRCPPRTLSSPGI